MPAPSIAPAMQGQQQNKLTSTQAGLLSALPRVQLYIKTDEPYRNSKPGIQPQQTGSCHPHPNPASPLLCKQYHSLSTLDLITLDRPGRTLNQTGRPDWADLLATSVPLQAT